MDIEQLIQRNTFGHLFMNSKVKGLISQQFCQTATPQGLGNHSSVHRCSKQSTMISTTGIFVRGRNHPKISPFSVNLWKTRPNLWKTQVWWLRSPSNSTQPKDRSIVGSGVLPVIANMLESLLFRPSSLPEKVHQVRYGKFKPFRLPYNSHIQLFIVTSTI